MNTSNKGSRTPTNLQVSEEFLSIQGEGKTCGVRAVFLRLSGCVCTCTWCDTEEVWKRGDFYEPHELMVLFKEKGYIDAIAKGAHLVLTGGDPLMQQTRLSEFLILLFAQLGMIPYIEVETEAVIQPKQALDQWVRQYNVSPKLANSGMPIARRFIKGVFAWHSHDTRSFFKIPVSTEADVDEFEKLAEGENLRILRERNALWLLPLSNHRENWQKKAPVLAEVAMRRGYNLSPRLQLTIWDACTGR